MSININKIIQKILPYIFILLIAYALDTILFSLLPKSGVDFKQENKYNLKYRQYSGFYGNIEAQKKEKEKPKKKVEATLSQFVLKAIYSKNDNSGWATIESKNGDKSYIIAQYEKLEDYLLTKLYKNHIIFEKSGKEYKLTIAKDKKVSYEMEQRDSEDEIKQNIVVKEDMVQVKRNYLNSYAKNLSRVWKNIAINEIVKDGKIDGFRIERVNQNSVFAKLGLKKGDIIKAINNNILGSYADAFKAYNNINSTQFLNIEILRNNEIMELKYEIE